MAKTGIKVDTECNTVYQSYKMTGGGKAKPYDFVTLKIENNKVVIDLCPEHGSTAEMEEYKDCTSEPPAFKRLKVYLLERSCSYAFYDFEWEEKDGVNKNDLKFIYWANDDKANTKDKMTYSGTKDEVVKVLKTGKEIQANDSSDLVYKDIIEDLSKGKVKK